MRYKGFNVNEISLVAGFDIDEAKHNIRGEIPIFPLSQLNSFVNENNIKHGIISVPDFAAQEVLDVMIEAGIRGVLNFAPIYLKESRGCVVRNLNLETELENIIYFTALAGKGEVGK